MEQHEQMKFDGYQDFVSKFKTKKTTDDCYTPPLVYEAVADFAAKHYGLSRDCFVRPFYPGGDFEREDYTDLVVVDNPPFSILSKIVNFYTVRKIPFFLFAPTLTILGTSKDCCAVICDCSITYDNGAVVNTSFITNLEPTEPLIVTYPELYSAVKRANDAGISRSKAEIPVYKYPDSIITAAACNPFAKNGIAFQLDRNEAEFIRAMDSQRRFKKTIFGSGYLVSTAASRRFAAAKEAAAKETAAKEVMEWQLSYREQQIIALLDKR